MNLDTQSSDARVPIGVAGSSRKRGHHFSDPSPQKLTENPPEVQQPEQWTKAQKGKKKLPLTHPQTQEERHIHPTTTHR